MEPNVVTITFTSRFAQIQIANGGHWALPIEFAPDSPAVKGVFVNPHAITVEKDSDDPVTFMAAVSMMEGYENEIGVVIQKSNDGKVAVSSKKDRVVNDLEATPDADQEYADQEPVLLKMEGMLDF